jgi:hypothetical protein
MRTRPCLPGHTISALNLNLTKRGRKKVLKKKKKKKKRHGTIPATVVSTSPILTRSSPVTRSIGTQTEKEEQAKEEEKDKETISSASDLTWRRTELEEERTRLVLSSKDWFLELAGLVLDTRRSSTNSLRQDIRVLEHLVAMHKLTHSLLSSVEDAGEEEEEWTL